MVDCKYGLVRTFWWAVMIGAYGFFLKILKWPIPLLSLILLFAVIFGGIGLLEWKTTIPFGKRQETVKNVRLISVVVVAIVTLSYIWLMPERLLNDVTGALIPAITISLCDILPAFFSRPKENFSDRS